MLELSLLTPMWSGRYFINLDSMAVTLEDGTSQALDTVGSVRVLLDSGTTTSIIPSPAFDAFVAKVGAKPIEGTSPVFYSVDCSLSTEDSTLDYTFGSVTIQVPYKDFIGPTFGDEGQCPLQIQPQGNNPSRKSDPSILRFLDPGANYGGLKHTRFWALPSFVLRMSCTTRTTTTSTSPWPPTAVPTSSPSAAGQTRSPRLRATAPSPSGPPSPPTTAPPPA